MENKNTEKSIKELLDASNPQGKLINGDVFVTALNNSVLKQNDLDNQQTIDQE